MTFIELLDKHWDGFGYFLAFWIACWCVAESIGAISRIWSKHE